MNRKTERKSITIPILPKDLYFEYGTDPGVGYGVADVGVHQHLADTVHHHPLSRCQLEQGRYVRKSGVLDNRLNKIRFEKDGNAGKGIYGKLTEWLVMI